MKKRMEIKLKGVFVFDGFNPEDGKLIEILAEVPLAAALAHGLKMHGLKVVAVEKADRTLTDLDRQLPREPRVRAPRRKAG